MSYQKDAFDLVKRFSGQENILSVPRVFCEVTGSLEAGMLLSQLLFWSDKGDDPDGWFYKSYVEWKQHVFLTEYQIRKFSKQFEEAGFLETKLKKANGTPTLHYRIKRGEFSEWILKNLGIETEKFQNPNPNISESSIYTETTTETTTKKIRGSDRAIARPSPEPTPPAPPTATPSKAKLLPNDGYDVAHRNGSSSPSPNVATAPLPKSQRVDGRKFKGGRIPAGQGANAVEIFYERYNINETKLSAPKEDDLIAAVTDLKKWREVVIAWEQSDYKATNIKGQLDWYRDGIPDKSKNGTAGSNGTGFGLTAYAEKERKQYERDFGPDEKLTPEKERSLREYFERRANGAH